MNVSNNIFMCHDAGLSAWKGLISSACISLHRGTVPSEQHIATTITQLEAFRWLPLTATSTDNSIYKTVN
jgi:hypothetical protein